MKNLIIKSQLKMFGIIFFMSAILSCNTNNNTEYNDSSMVKSELEVIPDSIVRFLITSASDDFREHRPPTAIDFRNLKIGYLKSANSDKIFILCGEFLSQENNEWIEFATLKTSGYEQYIGKTQYCQDATMVMEGDNLSLRLKNNLTE